MSRKSNLLKLFTENTEYYFHIVSDEIGHLIYVSQEKNEYTTEGLEFKLNTIIEGFLGKSDDVGFEKVAPSIYFTEEKDTNKIKYILGEDMMENSDFSSFIEDIKNEYRSLEVEDYLLYKKDPEAYEKKKEEDYQKQQMEKWDKYKKQQEEQERIKRTAIKQYDGDLIKLFKDNFLNVILSEEKKFKLRTPFNNIIYSILTNDEEQAKLWPMRDNQTITGNNKFNAIEIEGNTMSILIADKMSDSHIIKFKLNGSELNIDDVVNNVDKDTKHMSDCDFLMKIYNFDITPDFIDWENMYENEKLDAVIEEIIKRDKEESELREKTKNEIVDSSTAKAFFTINKYEIKINKIPGITTQNVPDELLKPVEDILNEMDIEFKRGEWLKDNVEFIEVITFGQIEKLYTRLIEIGYMLDTYKQDGEYPFMDLRKPDTSQYKIYVGWEDSDEQYSEDDDYYDDEFSFNIYTSHVTSEVYDQEVRWIDKRTKKILEHLNVGDFYIDFGAAENLHSISVKNASKGNLKKKVNDFINKIKNIIDNSEGFEWYD